ncbi:MAG: hypothetical protein ACLP6W_11320 [Bryobacteraceae bacterium]
MTGELDFEIGMDCSRFGGRFGQLGPHGDDGKLRAARYLKHVKIAVAVPRIKRLDGYRDQQIALPGMTDALASRGVADAIGVM